MRKRFGPLVLAFLVPLLFVASAAAQTEPSLSLRVVTWNVWGVPVVSAHREERMERIGPAVGALEPDLVALQEVWTREDAEALMRSLRASGLPHSQYYAGRGRESGLLLASRYPFEDLGFSAFTLGSTSHVPWHVDWVANKGVARVRVHTPAGPVDFATTHMQAPYGEGGYYSVRLGQSVQAARVLGTIGSGPPLVLGGDLNSGFADLPRRILQAQTGVVDAAPEFGIDTVLFRDGEQDRLRLVRTRRVFHEPVTLRSGVRMPLSDHDGLLVELELSACGGSCLASIQPAEVLRDALGEAMAVAERSAAKRRLEMWVARLSLLPLGVGMVVVFRRKPRRREKRAVNRFALGGSAVLLAWLLHFGFLHGPASVHGHSEMRGHLLELTEFLQVPSAPLPMAEDPGAADTVAAAPASETSFASHAAP